MGLAFDAIEPVVYPVAMQLLQSGMEGYHVAARIFKQFGKEYDVPNNETNTAMIYLSVTCAETDFLKKKHNGINENDDIYDSFNIAGFSYCDRNDIVEELRVGFELKLITEPNNKYDKYAVAIYYDEHKLGYIPMKKNKNISQLINLGHNDIFKAKIREIKETDNLEEKINVIITIFSHTLNLESRR